MTLRLHLGENSQQRLIRANQESGSFNAYDLSPIHIFLFQYVKLLADLFLHVSQKRIRQVVFLFELALGLWSIARNAKHHGSRLLQLLNVSRKPQASIVQPGVSALG